MTESPSERRRRLINLGELIALAALIVSAAGVWIAWKSTSNDKPTRVVEQRQPIPLTLRGRAEDNGRSLVISPVEPSHALESLTVAINRAYPEVIGSDGVLKAEYVESRLTGKQLDKGDHAVKLGFDIHYVEIGKDREAHGDYTLHYRVDGGGLLGGRSLRLVSLSR
jgi:hypothetical protein